MNLNEEENEQEEIKKKEYKKFIHKSINSFKSQTPIQKIFGKSTQLVNGSIFDKKESSNKNKSNQSINYNLEAKNVKKKIIILRNKDINNNIISNGETSEYDKNENYEFIRKRLLARKIKDKKNITQESSKIKKDHQKSETSKNLRQNQISISKKNLNAELLKDLNNKINNNTTSGKIIKAINEKTIDQIESIKIRKDSGSLNFYKPSNLFGAYTTRSKKIEDLHFSRRNSSKKNSLTNNSKKESKFLNSLKANNMTPFNSKIRDKDKFQLPTLGNSNLPSAERPNFTNYSNTYKNLYASINIPNKRNNIGGRRITGVSQNKIDEEITAKIFEKKIPGTNSNNKQSFISKLIRKQTVNLDEKKSFSKISTKILNRNLIKYNKLKKKLKNELKVLDNKYGINNNKINIVNEEMNQCKLFIENKINKVVLKSQKDIEIFHVKEKLEFNRNENKKYIKKEKKFIHIIVMDFIKKISSPIHISFLYLDYHKDVIDKGILRHIAEKFFDISLPNCLFDNRNLNLYINEIPKKNFAKLLKRQNTIDSKKMDLMNRQDSNKNSIKIFEKNNKVSRRLSTIIHERRESILNNDIYHDEIEKKSLIYCYLDINLYDEAEAKKNDNDDSFLELLKSNSLNNDNINKLKNNEIKNKHSLFSKKSSIKNSNNLSMSKVTDIFKADKKSFFRNNFFNRNEIKNLNIKVKNNSSKKKSLLEYNLLFDPSLTGYNNLVYDPEVTKDPNKIQNTDRNVITKSDLKELQKLKNKQLTSFINSSGGMKTDKNIYVMKTLDLKNQYNHKNKGNINSLISSIKDCNYDSFVKFYRTCNCGPNAIDKDGNSLLSLAVRSSCPEIVNFLLDEKANPNLQNVIIYIL